MNITYTILLITVLSCFVLHKKAVTVSLIVMSCAVAILEGIINLYGLAAIFALYIVTYLCFKNKKQNTLIKIILWSSIILLGFGFFNHIIPGFYNILVVKQVALSPLSIPYTMYLNFDKVMMGIILLVNSPLYQAEKNLNRSSMIQTILFLIACASTLLIPSFVLGYIKFDFKIPSILALWCINNLFFVCLTEEVVFRGIIQNQFKYRFKKYNVHIFMAALLFGLAHFRGGITYILLSAIAGCFYGFTYDKTKRIFCSMMVHFGLNLTHIVFFTYPAATSLH